MDNQFSLLNKKRFLPFFITQFLGAFNDNVFKNALLILIVFKLVTEEQAGLFTNLAAGLFILPFFLFSSIAGQIAEKYEKSFLIKLCKFIEILIMLGGATAFYIGEPYLLIVILFLMGTQSTFFGPIKYSILPQHLKEEELIGGNGLVEMGTFVSILIGTMVGSYFILENNGVQIISAIIVGVSILGYLSSCFIPKAESLLPDTKINFNIISESFNLFKTLKQRRKSVYLSVLGISWFWFLGAVYLTQFPSFVKNELQGDASVVTLLLATFSIGIAIGSILCESLSRKRIELGIVPFGSIGLTLFGILLYFSVPSYDIKLDYTINYLYVLNNYYWVVFNMFMIGIFGGFYTVPLYALIQKRTEAKYRSRIIAANNMFNALFMVFSAAFSILLLNILNFSVSELFLTLSIINAFVALFIYNRVPEFFIRFVIWMLTHTMYRVKHYGIDNLPEKGACIIASNHISFVDALLLGGAFKRPVRFVMYEPIYRIPILKQFFKAAGAIPIDSRKNNLKVYNEAFIQIKKLLENGEVLCIFPEGKLTSDGEINKFQKGIEKIVKDTPSPVIPVAIRGLWGSMFSRKYKIRFPRPKWSRVEIIAGDIIHDDSIKADLIESEVKKLKGQIK